MLRSSKSAEWPYGCSHRPGGWKTHTNSPFAYENYYDFDPTNKIKNSGVSLQADIDFANDILMTSITAYREQSRDDNADVDFTRAALIG